MREKQSIIHKNTFCTILNATFVQPQSRQTKYKHTHTCVYTHATVMTTDLVILGRNPLDSRQHMKSVSEKSLMQWHADSPAHRQPGAMIPFTFGPLPLRLLHNQSEWTRMSSWFSNALLTPQADYQHPSHPANVGVQFLTACHAAEVNVQIHFRPQEKEGSTYWLLKWTLNDEGDFLR